MDYAVFQDCVKSMDLRQRFQKLQDEIYILIDGSNWNFFYGERPSTVWSENITCRRQRKD